MSGKKELGALGVSMIRRRGVNFVGGVAGLAANVLKSGARSWVLRYQIGGRCRDEGLGGYSDVTLADAKIAARAARALIAQGRHGLDPMHTVHRHEQCGAESLDKDDAAANQSALKDTGRIFSCYDIGGEKVWWVITEAVGEDGSRAGTTLLPASEY